MKKLLIVIINLLPTLLFAQGNEGVPVNTVSPLNLSTQFIYRQSNEIISTYKLALRNAVNCSRNVDFTSFCNNYMADGATIEVASTRSGRKKNYPALKYFSLLRALACSDDKIYQSIKFLFTDFPIVDDSIHVDQFNHYLVNCRIGQTFTGLSDDGKSYSDYTIKLIMIDFSPGRNGASRPRISKILVESCNSTKQ
jgi:hypothetical protein